MTRANPPALPFLMNEPTSRWIGEIFTECSQRFFDDEFRFEKKIGPFQRRQVVSGRSWIDSRSPKYLIRHPVADSRETVLHEQDGFDRCFRVSIQELIDEPPVKFRGADLGNVTPPPSGLILPLVKADATKLSGIGKDQRAYVLVQNEVIVLSGTKGRRFNPQFAAHAEMDSNPIPGGEFEQHLLPPCKGTEEPASG